MSRRQTSARAIGQSDLVPGTTVMDLSRFNCDPPTACPLIEFELEIEDGFELEIED